MINSRFDRRDFLKLGAAGLKLGAAGLAAAGIPGLAGCVHDPTTLPRLALGPNPAMANNQILSHSVNIPIREGMTDAVRSLLESQTESGGLFAHESPGIHFARIELLDQREVAVSRDQVSLGIIYDQRFETAINFLTENRLTLDPLLQLCEGYCGAIARDPVALAAYLQKYLAADKLFFAKYNTAESEVKSCVTVQDNFLKLLRAANTAHDSELPYLFDRFLLGDNWKPRMSTAPRPVERPHGVPFSPHLTNTLGLVQPLMQGRLDPKKVVRCSNSIYEKIERFLGRAVTYEQLFNIILTEGEFAVRQLHTHPLIALHTLHFARIAVVDGNMVFSSVYDGDFTQYVLDFGSQVADEIDLIWGLTENYPPSGCRDIEKFITWIRGGQVDVQSFFSASGDVTLIQLEKAVALRTKLVEFSHALPPDGAKLRRALAQFTRENQALLS